MSCGGEKVARPGGEEREEGDEEQLRTLWCGGVAEKVLKALRLVSNIFSDQMNFKVDEEMLYELFQNAGPLERVNIPTDRVSKKQKNFAFIVFQHEESLQYAFDLFNGTELFRQPLRLQNKTTGLGKSCNATTLAALSLPVVLQVWAAAGTGSRVDTGTGSRAATGTGSRAGPGATSDRLPPLLAGNSSRAGFQFGSRAGRERASRAGAGWADRFISRPGVVGAVVPSTGTVAASTGVAVVMASTEMRADGGMAGALATSSSRAATVREIGVTTRGAGGPAGGKAGAAETAAGTRAGTDSTAASNHQ